MATCYFVLVLCTVICTVFLLLGLFGIAKLPGFSPLAPRAYHSEARILKILRIGSPVVC